MTKTSSTSTEMVEGYHRFTLEKYSLCKGIGEGRCILSDLFIVGGYKWAIGVFPDGTSEDKILGGDKYEEGHVYVDLVVTLQSKSDGVPMCVNLTLLDQSGKGNHRTSFNNVPRVINTCRNMGSPCFINRDVLEKSSFLKDDCLKIECTLSVLLPSETTEITIAASDDDDDDDDGEGVDFLAILSSGEGSDVVLSVEGEKFHAHKTILSARSSVFESMFASRLVTDQHEMVIREVEPGVFKALLHFIYSDTLPEKERRCLIDGYAFGPSVSTTIGAKLLAAADKYDVKLLKSICESHLWRSISVSRFAEILSLAVKYNASDLKHLCFKFAVDNYAVLVELDKFSCLEKKWPLLLSEVNDYISKARSSS